MYFKGKVTKLDLKFCSFILENEITVYAGLYYLQFKEDEIEFPDLNSCIVVEEGIIYNKILFPKKIMCQSTCSRQQTELCLPFIRLLKQHNLQVLDTINIIKSTEKIQNKQIFSVEFLKSISWCQNFSFSDIIFKFAPFLLTTPNSIFDESNYNILTPDDHKLENAEHINLVKWNFGVNNFKNNTYLVGYLEVSSDIGYIVLRDSKHNLVCLIASENRIKFSENLSKLLNNFVVIKNYYIFSENTKNFGTIRYALVSINDVHILEKRENTEIDNTSEGILVNIKVINRCSVTYNPMNDGLDCLVHCFINSQETTKECLIRLCGEHFARYPLFNTGDNYVLSTKMSYSVDQLINLKSDKYLKMDNINLPVFTVPSDGILTLLPFEVSDFNFLNFQLLNVSEVKNLVEENLEFQKDERDIRGFERNYFKQKPDNKLISFEGVIKRRKALGADKYAQKPVKNAHFGIKGTDVHQLYFTSLKFDSEFNIYPKSIAFYSNDNLNEAERLYVASRTQQRSDEGLSLYLHNFRLLQTPLGLVENMKVAVRYVSNPKDKKYFKPCLFTSIEPLAYVPPQDFDTTPELIGNLHWGPPAPLGASNHIPTSCLVWGETLLLQITALNIHLRCTKCKDIFFPNQEICCGVGLDNGTSEAPKLDITLGMKCVDHSGPFDTVCKDETVLKKILGLREHEWIIFRKALLSLKYWTCNSREPERIQQIIKDQRTSGQETFAEYLSIFVSAFNEMGFHNFDLKCRKMFKTEIDLLEKWYIVEARPSLDIKNLNMSY